MTDIVETPYSRWQQEITQAVEDKKKFHERGIRVTRKFIDERGAAETANRWFNVFYANTNILQASLYARLPDPQVSRQFQDYDDDIARVAALIVQRAITQDLDDPRDTFDAMMRHAVQDRLIPGLGQAWLRLETDTEVIPAAELVDMEPQPGMETAEIGEEASEDGIEPPQRITDQRVCVDYVYWRDFLWSPCRVWEERRWVARRVYMDREELVERFGPRIGNDCVVEVRPESGTEKYNESNVLPKDEAIKKAEVWEIWERSTRKVYWYSKGYPDLLDTRDDPLSLVGFEPCPRPMLANISTSNSVPRPDYYMIQDQYMELDTINNRISLLVQACKVAGVYDKGQPGIVRLLQEGNDNLLIPVDNWAMFAEKNGLKGQIDWLPLETIVQALNQLNMARETIKAQIYELTGISDIVRGASKASETLGAQQIKAQFAGVRIESLQAEIARFAGDVLRIKAEMMVKHFSPELLITKSNIMATGEGNIEYVGPAMALLASDVGFEWRISVATDSMAQVDYQAEKADRTEFLNSVSGFMKQALPIVQAMPEAKAMVVGMLKWGVAGFKKAQEIEGMLDKELDALMKPQPPEPPPPDPALIKAQADAQAKQQEAQLDAQARQQEMQLEQQKAMLELQKAEREAQLEEQRMMMEMAFERQRQEAELAFQRQMQAMELLAQRMELKFQESLAEIKQQQAAKPQENDDGA